MLSCQYIHRYITHLLHFLILTLVDRNLNAQVDHLKHEMIVDLEVLAELLDTGLEALVDLGDREHLVYGQVRVLEDLGYCELRHRDLLADGLHL